MPKFIANQRLFLNEERNKVVREDDPEASYLLAAQGKPISQSLVDRLKISQHFNASEEKAQDKSEDKSEEKGEDKSKGGLTVTKRSKRQG